MKLDHEKNSLNHEERISEKIKISIKTKLEVRLKNGEITEQEKKILEEELWEEMKEEIKKGARNLKSSDEPT